jgi:hypothetical protein
VEELFVDDLLDVLHADKTEPDRLRTDHDDRPVFALVEAADSLARIWCFRPASLMASLKADFNFLLPSGWQLGRGSALVPLVGEDEDVMVKLWHCCCFLPIRLIASNAGCTACLAF